MRIPVYAVFTIWLASCSVQPARKTRCTAFGGAFPAKMQSNSVVQDSSNELIFKDSTATKIQGTSRLKLLKPFGYSEMKRGYLLDKIVSKTKQIRNNKNIESHHKKESDFLITIFALVFLIAIIVGLFWLLNLLFFHMSFVAILKTILYLAVIFFLIAMLVVAILGNDA